MTALPRLAALLIVVAFSAAAVVAPSPAGPATALSQVQIGQHQQRFQQRHSPLTLALTAAPGELEIALRFSPTDSGQAPIASLALAKGTSQTLIASLTAADFANPPAGVEILPLAATDTSYIDQAVSEGVHYSYKLHGCDAGPDPTCALSGVARASPGPVPLTFLLGAEELVFDAPAEACDTTTGFDVSDVFVRAVRRSDGSILLISGNSRGNFYLEGPDFDSLQRNCTTPAPLDSNFEDDPALRDYQRWVHSVCRDPDSAHPDRIHALIHHEYHETISPPCDAAGPRCWYNQITYAYSDDGGRSYIQASGPARLVASLPYPFDQDLSAFAAEAAPLPSGYFLATNIFKGLDGYAYVFVYTTPNPVAADAESYLHYMTLMRSDDLGDAQSWRFWDGSGFNHRTRDPYVDGVSHETAIANPTQYLAGQIDMPWLSGSIAYNTYLQKYMFISAVGSAEIGLPCGFYYMLSNDLFHWSIPRIFRNGNIFTCDEEAPQDVYPSAIDHQDTSVNFEYADDTFVVYFLHYATHTDRDVIRIPVRITHP